MKKLIFSLILILSLSGPALAAPAYEPVDLMYMREAGMSNESIGRYLAQNLGAGRQAPPVEAELLMRLSRYGGDSLAVAYLDLDRATAAKPERTYSPEVVEQLINSGLAPDELRRTLLEEAARETASDQASDSASAPAAAPAPAAERPSAPPRAPQMARLDPPQAPEMKSPTLPRPQPPQRTYQELRPGQAADPASRLPVPYSTYDIRNERHDGQTRLRQRNDGGPWMGVMERELPDAHLAEVNSIGQVSLVGQEVFSRPSGHKVYRYYSGDPDYPRSGADPRQERKNREDLAIIFNR